MERNANSFERMLTRSFDRQRFEKNSRLQAIIDRSHERLYSRELNDFELESLAAAGEKSIEETHK